MQICFVFVVFILFYKKSRSTRYGCDYSCQTRICIIVLRKKTKLHRKNKLRRSTFRKLSRHLIGSCVLTKNTFRWRLRQNRPTPAALYNIAYSAQKIARNLHYASSNNEGRSRTLPSPNQGSKLRLSTPEPPTAFAPRHFPSARSSPSSFGFLPDSDSTM